MTRRPQDPIENLQHEVERVFLDLVYHRHPACHFAEPRWAPPADLVVSEHGARVILELAGVPRESVKVKIRGNLLEISGRREPPQQPGIAYYHRAEISFGDFQRHIELPWTADEDSVDARYRDGMLEIQLKPAAAQLRASIPIEEQPAP